ncbi:hypothetical protein VTN96DRAFT_9922 [Rasamsonia emersonii]
MSSMPRSEIIPVIAIDIGVSGPLDRLFKDAEKLLHGTEGYTQLVLLINIQEDWKRVDVYPWGLTGQELRDWEEVELADWILEWHHAKGVPLVGEFKVTMYMYSKDMERRPTGPFDTYDFSLTGPLKKGALSGLFFDKDFRVKLFGIEIRLPLEQLEV